MNEPGPAKQRALLGQQLRSLRVRANLEQSAVTTQMGWRPEKISRAERGQRALTARELEQLLALYEVDEETTDHVLAIGTQARKRGRYGRVPEWSRQYFGLEQDARHLGFYRGELIPGLLQTEAYARALVATSKIVAPADMDGVVEARMARRALLHSADAPTVHLIIGEAAIRRQVGGRVALSEQLEHLEEMAALPHVTLQVLPFTSGAHAAIGADFTLITLDVGGEPATWAYLSDLTRGDCRPESSQVRAYQLTFDSLAVNALGESETLALLRQARET